MLRENSVFVSFTEITGSAPYDTSNKQLLTARNCRGDKHKAPDRPCPLHDCTEDMDLKLVSLFESQSGL